MTDRRKRAVAQGTWRLLVLFTLALAPGWDALGLLVGDTVYGSPSYDVLRHMTPWGMRAYGPALVVLTVTTVYAYGRYSAGDGLRGYKLLRVCLSLLAAWYVLWTIGLVGSWVVHHQILSWGVGKVALPAVTLFILARRTPTDRVT